MQLSKIMLAVVAATAASSAFAAPNANRIAITAGASAVQNNFFLNTTSSSLKNLCPAVYTVLGTGNFRAAYCATVAVTNANYGGLANASFVDFTGTGYAEVRVNTEGSFSSVILLNPVVNPVRPQVHDAATGLASSVYPAGSVVVGGILDLDPANGTPVPVIGANELFPTANVGMAQVFGVAASDKLYAAMFAQQQTDGLIPAAPTCTVASVGTSYCVPSVSVAQMATIMADNSFNAAYANGLAFLAPSHTDVAPTPATPAGWVGPATPGTCQVIASVNTCIPTGTTTAELRYVRRVDNSGTQTAAQNYFLGLPCSKQPLTIVPEPTTDSAEEPGGLKDALITNIRVFAAPGTGDVRTELNRSTVTQAGPDGIIVPAPGDLATDNVLINNYALGVVSMENVQTAQGWKWLRVNGAMGADSAAPASLTNRAATEAGRYNFVYEAVTMGGSPAGDAFWSIINSTLGSTALPGLIPSATLGAGYNKNGAACAGWSSN